MTFSTSPNVVHPGACHSGQCRTNDHSNPHPHRVGKKCRERAAYQHSVETPKTVSPVLVGKPKDIARQGRDDDSDERTPCHEWEPFFICAPKNSGKEKNPCPHVVLKHYLAYASRYGAWKFFRGLCYKYFVECHGFLYLMIFY